MALPLARPTMLPSSPPAHGVAKATPIPASSAAASSHGNSSGGGGGGGGGGGFGRLARSLSLRARKTPAERAAEKEKERAAAAAAAAASTASTGGSSSTAAGSGSSGSSGSGSVASRLETRRPRLDTRRPSTSGELRSVAAPAAVSNASPTTTPPVTTAGNSSYVAWGRTPRVEFEHVTATTSRSSTEERKAREAREARAGVVELRDAPVSRGSWEREREEKKEKRRSRSASASAGAGTNAMQGSTSLVKKLSIRRNNAAATASSASSTTKNDASIAKARPTTPRRHSRGEAARTLVRTDEELALLPRRSFDSLYSSYNEKSGIEPSSPERTRASEAVPSTPSRHARTNSGRALISSTPRAKPAREGSALPRADAFPGGYWPPPPYAAGGKGEEENGEVWDEEARERREGLRGKAPPYWVVKRGWRKGIYDTKQEAEEQVKNFPGPLMRCFDDADEAVLFLCAKTAQPKPALLRSESSDSLRPTPTISTSTSSNGASGLSRSRSLASPISASETRIRGPLAGVRETESRYLSSLSPIWDATPSGSPTMTRDWKPFEAVAASPVQQREAEELASSTAPNLSGAQEGPFADQPMSADVASPEPITPTSATSTHSQRKTPVLPMRGSSVLVSTPSDEVSPLGGAPAAAPSRPSISERTPSLTRAASLGQEAFSPQIRPLSPSNPFRRSPTPGSNGMVRLGSTDGMPPITLEPPSSPLTLGEVAAPHSAGATSVLFVPDLAVAQQFYAPLLRAAVLSASHAHVLLQPQDCDARLMLRTASAPTSAGTALLEMPSETLLSLVAHLRQTTGGEVVLADTAWGTQEARLTSPDSSVLLLSTPL